MKAAITVSYTHLDVYKRQVPQRAVLFTGTIESNLKWGNEHATKEQMEQALHIAQAEEFVSRLPKGLQTEVSQGGTNFSGGQRQLSLIHI